MRFKFVAAALSGLFMAGVAFAQTPDVAGPPPIDPQNVLNLDLSTGGRVQVQLRPDKAPGSVERIKTLVRRHFYDGLVFHRVIEGFMAQGGDPKGTGEGGSELPDLKAEFNDMPHVRGVMAMARAQSLDSANSQFFIMLQPNLGLDGNYTAIGRVIAGMQFVDAIEKGEPPANPSKIVRASIESDNLGMAPIATPIPEAAPPAPPAPKTKKELKAAREQAERDAKAADKAAKEQADEEKRKAKEDDKAKRKAAKDAASANSGTSAAVREVSGEQVPPAGAAPAAEPVAPVPAPEAAAVPADPATGDAVSAVAGDATVATPQ